MSQGRGSSGNSNSSGRSTGGRGSQKGRGRGGRGRGGRGRGGRGKGRDRFHNKNNRNGRNQEKNDQRQNLGSNTRSYTIGPKDSNLAMGTRENVTDHEEVSVGAYQYCTRKECEERQELKQIHELEATLDTCSLPQAQRKIDPCLAVSKFKRSAAGTTHTVKPAEVLNRTLSHLQVICATRQASPEYPPVDNLHNWSEFLVDRLRAIQADATRLSSTDVGVSQNWHVQLVRILIWVRYWTYSLIDMSWLQRTISTMIGTATESYWGQGERLEGLSDAEEKQHERMDDEMLCWSALLQVSKQQEHQAGSPMGQTDDSGCNSILLDFAKLSTTRKISHHPMWSQVLMLASHLIRHEYYAAWKKIESVNASIASKPMSILFNCCIEPNLSLWRYRTIQHYNKSFAKEEHVTSFPILLSIHPDGWNLDRARDVGLPVEQKDDGEIALVCKKLPLEDDFPLTKAGSRVRDHWFTFGECYDGNENMRISSARIDQILKAGMP